MKKRTALGMVTAVALLAGCSSPTVSTQVGLHAQMSGAAINSSNGRYRAGAADIALTKIVSLPDDHLGFRFVISAPSLRGGCCSFFPRIAVVGQTKLPSSDGTYEIDVAEGPASVASDGTIDLRLFGGSHGHLLGTFRLDLPALGVSR